MTPAYAMEKNDMKDATDGVRFKLWPLRFVLGLHAWKYCDQSIYDGKLAAIFEWLHAMGKKHHGIYTSLYNTSAIGYSAYDVTITFPFREETVSAAVARALLEFVCDGRLEQSVTVTRRWDLGFFRKTSKWLNNNHDADLRLRKQWNSCHPGAREFYGLEAYLHEGRWVFKLRYGYDGSHWYMHLRRGEPDPNCHVSSNDIWFPAEATNEEFDVLLAKWLDENLRVTKRGKTA